jgi:glycosyltransferase involved in cell wall biosynthesis
VTVTTIDVLMPARDEALTVAENVNAARACRYVRDVIVIDDGSTDGTGDIAAAAGAKVIVRDDTGGSKAHAMAAGVEASDADAFLFVDADCTGLTAAHLDAICEPLLEGRATLSLGAFDYGKFWNPMVLRWPPLSGERIIPRWVWDAIPPHKLDGYTIEVRINEVVAERRLHTVARTMKGVYHRTKRVKLGRRQGVRSTWTMYRELLKIVWPIGDVRLRTYWFYLRGLTVER